jgi:hypothetical protein
MPKVVYNACYGGFGVSDACAKLVIEKMVAAGRLHDAQKLQAEIDEVGESYGSYAIKTMVRRHDPALIAAIEELGVEKARGMCAELCIEEIEGSVYRIDVYDGYESLVEPHGQEWLSVADTGLLDPDAY